jgi:hypothetical protein
MKKPIMAFICLIFFSILVSGCVQDRKVMGQAATKNFETRVVDASRDCVFNAALEALFDLGYTIKHSDKESGILLGEKQDARKGDKAAMTFLFGITGALSVTPIVYNCTIMVKPVDEKTTNVRIKTAIDGEPKLYKETIDQVWLYIDRQVLMESPPHTEGLSKHKVQEQTQLKHVSDQTDRLKSFLFSYCQAYESKDLDKFATFFTPDATENNKDFHELLPTYRKNMEMIESFNYRVDIISYSLGTDTDNIRIKGKYFTRFLYKGILKENSGNISMDLVENSDSYLVKQLNYTFQPGKKADKQSQWGPWIDVGNKE